MANRYPGRWARLVSAARLAIGGRRAREDERDMRDEMQFHIDMQTNRNVERGMSRDEGRRAAKVAFGGAVQWMEAARDELRSRPLDDFARDVRYALGGLRRHPTFAATAIATIGLGIAAAVTVFTIVDSLFLRPLPVPAGNRLVRVYFPRPDAGDYSLGLAGVRLLRQRVTAFDAVIAHDSRDVLQIGIGESSRGIEQHGAFVSANYWTTLGIRPRVGRFFTPEEDSVPDRDPVVVVSSAFWHSQLGDDPAVLGTHLQIGGRHLTIIGVAPEGFEGVAMGEMPNDVWLPLMMAHLGRFGCITEQPCRTGEALARLAPGATLAQARTQIRTLEPQLSAFAFRRDSVRHVVVAPAGGLSVAERSEYAGLARLLVAIATVILVIACANLSGLLLARGVSRERELSLRVSLGASRSRLARQLLTESLVVAVGGAVLGIVSSRWAARGLMGFFLSDDEGFPHFFNLTLDSRVLGFTLLASVATAILFGTLPALTASSTDPADVLKTGSGSLPRGRARSMLVAAQVGLAVVLLTTAALLLRSFQELANPRGFDVHHVAALRWRPDLAGYPPERSAAELRQIVARLRATPGVEAVGFRRCCGLLWSGAVYDVAIGHTVGDSVTTAQAYFASPDFFATLKVPVIAGRELSDGDRFGAPLVAVVNEALARRMWDEDGDRADASLVGRQLRVDSLLVRIVGVVPNYQVRTVFAPATPAVFLPYWQTVAGNDGDTRFAIRVRGDPAAALPALRRAFLAIDPKVLVTEMMPMTAQVDARYVQVRVGSAVLAMTAALALFLCAMGLYGVISFLVARRTREVGIRMALGATAAGVAGMFVAHGLRAVVAGGGVGVVVALAGTRFLGDWLFGVGPRDALSYAVALAAVALTALLASYVPARRASTIDPATALRVE